MIYWYTHALSVLHAFAISLCLVCICRPQFLLGAFWGQRCFNLRTISASDRSWKRRSVWQRRVLRRAIGIVVKALVNHISIMYYRYSIHIYIYTHPIMYPRDSQKNIRWPNQLIYGAFETCHSFHLSSGFKERVTCCKRGSIGNSKVMKKLAIQSRWSRSGACTRRCKHDGTWSFVQMRNWFTNHMFEISSA